MTLIELMKMGIKMVALSDAPKLEVWLRIVGLGLHHYFDHVVTSADAGARKPAPEPFRYALNILGTQPEETMMVGSEAAEYMPSMLGRSRNRTSTPIFPVRSYTQMA